MKTLNIYKSVPTLGTVNMSQLLNQTLLTLTYPSRQIEEVGGGGGGIPNYHHVWMYYGNISYAVNGKSLLTAFSNAVAIRIVNCMGLWAI
jgi:hypothetical protein